ncbi:MAG: class I SAM-dependent methyltransferase [Oligoflexia bacterium]|nr:class I SAM-dependent methyltransferase [Oligoflexia bacterium]
MFMFKSSRQNIRRQDPCCLCKAEKGNIVGKVNFIGLNHYTNVQCPKCGLISFDPIPEVKTTADGCSLLYQIQQSKEPSAKIIRGFKRSYRRGSYFARRYLTKTIEMSKESEFNILEVGAGDGYFSQGIRKIYPKAKITYVDIVADLISHYKKYFDCEAYEGELKQNIIPGVKKFDLIVMRDLLEHVRDPFSFLNDIRYFLNPEGHIFFITPNGLEDFWPCHQRFINNGEDEHLIYLNHFHYYLPKTLDELLAKCGFEKKIFFKFGLKRHRQGWGVKDFISFPIQTPPTLDDAYKTTPLATYWKHNPLKVFNSYLHGRGPIARGYSFFADREKDKVDYYDRKGHEFFVLAKKMTMS